MNTRYAGALAACCALISLSGCKVLPTTGATTVTGSRNDGIVIVAWQAVPFKGRQDYATPMLQAAQDSCHAWGYAGANPLGFANITYGAGIHGITPYAVAQRFQCTGSLPAPSLVASQAPVPPPAERRMEVSMGTGFAVLSRRTLATAFHVVDGAKVIEVVCGEGANATGIVEKIDPANDLALILISTPAPGYLEMSAENSLKVGQKVFTMGFPVPDVLGYEAKYTEGAISSLSGMQGAVSLIQTTVPIQPGNSGGPLSDEAGHVVGVVTSTAAVQSFLKYTGTLPQNINWAVKSEYLHPLLSGISQDPVYAAPAIERVEKSVCLIKAYK